MTQIAGRYCKSHSQALDAPFAGPSGSTKPGAGSRQPVDAVPGGERIDITAAEQEVHTLRKDLASLKDSLAEFVARAAETTARTARDAAAIAIDQTGTAAGHLADRSADMAAEATTQIKGLAADLERMARRNPLGAIAAAAAVGVIIGMMGRRR